MKPVLHRSTNSTGAVAIASRLRLMEIPARWAIERWRVACLYHFFGLPVFSGWGPIQSGLNRPARGFDGAFAMRLLAYYIVFVLVGMVAAYLIGRAVEQWSASASLPVFLACFFFVFWAAWRLAVRVTA